MSTRDRPATEDKLEALHYQLIEAVADLATWVVGRLVPTGGNAPDQHLRSCGSWDAFGSWVERSGGVRGTQPAHNPAPGTHRRRRVGPRHPAARFRGRLFLVGDVRGSRSPRSRLAVQVHYSSMPGKAPCRIPRVKLLRSRAPLFWLANMPFCHTAWDFGTVAIQATVPKSQAVWQKGMFANQNSGARLRNSFTLGILHGAFPGIDE